MDKVQAILDMISEKSRALQDELDTTDSNVTNDDIKTELITQISILDETYQDAFLISRQDD